MFNGPDYTPVLDRKRLTKQHEVIRELMIDGVWRSLSEIAITTGYPESSISAQLRHLRKKRFGAYVVDKKRRGERTKGLFEYHLIDPRARPQMDLFNV